MTDMAGVLEDAKDTILTVSFKKKLDEKLVADKLATVNQAHLKVDKQLNAFSKQLLEGESCTLVCHLLQVETKLGRSLVHDLETKTVKMVDHRTIDYIVFKNVKYVLGKKKAEEEEKKDKDAPKFDIKKLAVGNWFSLTQYYKVISIEGDEVEVEKEGHSTRISRSILEYEMNNGMAFAKTEKMAMTKIAEVMTAVQDSVFTVAFHKKLDEKVIRE